MGHKIAPGRKPHPKIAVYRNLRSRIRTLCQAKYPNRPPPVRSKENPSFCPVDMNMRMRGKDDAPARKKVAFWVSEGLSEHKSKGSQRHNSQWVEMSNIGLTTKVLVLRHIA